MGNRFPNINDRGWRLPPGSRLGMGYDGGGNVADVFVVCMCVS